MTWWSKVSVMKISLLMKNPKTKDGVRFLCRMSDCSAVTFFAVKINKPQYSDSYFSNATDFCSSIKSAIKKLLLLANYWIKNSVSSFLFPWVLIFWKSQRCSNYWVFMIFRWILLYRFWPNFFRQGLKEHRFAEDFLANLSKLRNQKWCVVIDLTWYSKTSFSETIGWNPV